MVPLTATSGCKTSLPICSTNMLSTCSFRNEQARSFSRAPCVVMEFSERERRVETGKDKGNALEVQTGSVEEGP